MLEILLQPQKAFLQKSTNMHNWAGLAASIQNLKVSIGLGCNTNFKDFSVYVGIHRARHESKTNRCSRPRSMAGWLCNVDAFFWAPELQISLNSDPWTLTSSSKPRNSHPQTPTPCLSSLLGLLLLLQLLLLLLLLLLVDLPALLQLEPVSC